MLSFTRKIFFYRQLYYFYYEISHLAHKSRQNELKALEEASLDLNDTPIPKSMLFFASLPEKSFFKFLKYFLLTLCGLDKNILIDAKKIKALSHYFKSENVIALFHDEKKFFSNKIQLKIDIPEVITQKWVYSTAHEFLSHLYSSQSGEIYQRFLMRFPKDVDSQKANQQPQIENKMMLTILNYVLNKHFSSYSQFIDLK